MDRKRDARDELQEAPAAVGDRRRGSTKPRLARQGARHEPNRGRVLQWLGGGLARGIMPQRAGFASARVALLLCTRRAEEDSQDAKALQGGRDGRPSDPRPLHGLRKAAVGHRSCKGEGFARYRKDGGLRPAPAAAP